MLDLTLFLRVVVCDAQPRGLGAERAGAFFVLRVDCCVSVPYVYKSDYYDYRSINS